MQRPSLELDRAHKTRAVGCNDKDKMVNFQPGEYMRKMFFQTQAARKNKTEYLLVTGPSDRATTWRPDTNRDICHCVFATKA